MIEDKPPYRKKIGTFGVNRKSRSGQIVTSMLSDQHFESSSKGQKSKLFQILRFRKRVKIRKEVI